MFETVQPDDTRGFARFNLRWKKEERNIIIVGECEGLVHVRSWVYSRQSTISEHRNGDMKLLEQVALAYRDLILDGETSEKILRKAKVAEDKKDFARILALI